MKIALRGKRKTGFIDGSCKKEMQDEALQEAREQCNAVVLSWILNPVAKDIASSVIFFQDGYLVWSDLKERFDKVSGSRIFTLHREINNLRQESSTVSAYYSKLKELWEEQSTLFTTHHASATRRRSIKKGFNYRNFCNSLWASTIPMEEQEPRYSS